MTYTNSTRAGIVLTAATVAAACSSGSMSGGSAGTEAPGLPTGHPVVEAQPLNSKGAFTDCHQHVLTGPGKHAAGEALWLHMAGSPMFRRRWF